MSLWKRAGCKTESKALEKLIVARIVREQGLGTHLRWTGGDVLRRRRPHICSG